jgi:hypothetical protein
VATQIGRPAPGFVVWNNLILAPVITRMRLYAPWFDDCPNRARAILRASLAATSDPDASMFT